MDPKSEAPAGAKGAKVDTPAPAAPSVARESKAALPDGVKTYRVRHGSLFLSPSSTLAAGATTIMSPEAAAILLTAGLIEEV